MEGKKEFDQDKEDIVNTGYFIINEIKKRKEIEEKSELFCKAIDIAKGDILDNMAKEHAKRDEYIDKSLGEIENALLSDDPDQMKNALKNLLG